MKKNRLIVLAVILVFIGLLIASLLTANTSNNKLKIVTTLFPFYDMAKSIGKDKVEVTLLIPPGVEAHSFETKPSDILKITKSDIFIYAGDIMEPWAKDIIKSITDNSTTIIDASRGIKIIKENINNTLEMDPHFWLDFTNMIKIANSIERGMIVKDSANKDYYNTNSNEYSTQMNKLDRDYRTDLSKCKVKNIIFAGHFAFGYLEKKYGLSFVTAYGTAPNSEASAQDIANMVDRIKKDNTKYIYYEKILGPQLAQTLADETGASILPLNPADNITKDEYDNNVTFDSVMRSNLENLKTGLQCQ